MQLRNRFGFLKRNFSINFLNPKGSLDYLNGNSNLLYIGIQDLDSLKIENPIFRKSSYLYRDSVDEGLSAKEYYKQSGVIQISRERGIEERKIVLGDATYNLVWRVPSWINDFGLEKTFAR